MAHGDAREGKWRGKVANGVGSQYPSLPRNLVYPALLPLMRTPRLPVDWTDAPADLNGLVRFAERQKLVSARVPSNAVYSQTGHRRRNTAYAHCMLDNKGYKHIFRIFTIYCFSMATLVSRTRLSVKLYVNYICCSKLPKCEIAQVGDCL